MRRPVQFVTHALLAVALAATVAEAQQDRRRMRFRGMDQNRDGVITRSEWRGNARSFDVHDRNRDGILSGTEVRAAEDAFFDRTGWDDLVDQFDRTDRDNNGAITPDEWYGDRGTFRRLDRDRSGSIRLSEFLGEGLDEFEGDDIESVDPTRDDRVTGTMGRSAVGTEAYRLGYDRGLLEGRTAGREDRQLRNTWDLEGQQELERADSGYDASMGRRDHYQLGYRAGFRAGYRQGFGPREN